MRWPIVLAIVVLAGLYRLGTQPESAPVAAATASGWEADVLAGIGNTQPTAATIAYLSAWHRAEGGSASFNPLNTTQEAAGATCYNDNNGNCVKNYPDYQTGIQATIATLMNGRYPNTLAGLQSNQPIVDDGELGTWGTGGGALRDQLAQAAPAGRYASTPIDLGGDCGANVLLALNANGGALQHVRVAPGATFSFNATLGDPDAAGYRNCARVPGGNWCNLAARYSQVARALGLAPQFLHHGVDLGAGLENDVLIWNIGGVAGFEGGRQDLLITNTLANPVTFDAQSDGGSVTITGE